MALLQAALFFLASAGLVYVSRASLRKPQGHGFWRFWAWEAIAALVALAAPAWFRDPLAWHQLISWALLILSLIPLALGLQQLGRAQRDEQARSDENLRQFEKTTELVTTGVYRYFGPAYAAYMRRSRRFIPFLF